MLLGEGLQRLEPGGHAPVELAEVVEDGLFVSGSVPERKKWAIPVRGSQSEPPLRS